MGILSEKFPNAEAVEQALINATSIVTPEMFGAVGDGETDDYEAIQQAIEYAYDNNINAVYFAPKTYYISQTIHTRTTTGESQGTHYGVVGLKLYGVKGSILTRKHDDITPPAHKADDYEVACLALCSNNNIVENLEFRQSKIGLYLGYDPNDETGLANAHFNRVNNVYCYKCGIGIDMVAGYGCYYNNFVNCKISMGNMGIDMGNYIEDATSNKVCNRNTFKNSEVNKTFCGVRITGKCDTNVFDCVHFEQITLGYGQGTQPSWLPNNLGTAVFAGGRTNVFTKCMAETCTQDVYDTGYDNRYLYNTFELSKFIHDDTVDPSYLGMCMTNSSTANDSFINTRGYLFQSQSIIPDMPNWRNNFTSKTNFFDNVVFQTGADAYDTGYSQQIYTIPSRLTDSDNIIEEYIGGAASYSHDNFMIHKKVAGINYLFLKMAFIVKTGKTAETLSISIPASMNEEIQKYSNRVPLRFVGVIGASLSNVSTAFAYVRDDKLVINAPANGWSVDNGNFSTIDFVLTYV